MGVYLRDDDNFWDTPETEDDRPKCAHGLYQGDCDTCLDEAIARLDAGLEVDPEVLDAVAWRDALRRR